MITAIVRGNNWVENFIKVYAFLQELFEGSKSFLVFSTHYSLIKYTKIVKK